MKPVKKIWPLLVWLMLPFIGLILLLNMSSAFAQGSGQQGYGYGLLLSPSVYSMGALGLSGMGGALITNPLSMTGALGVLSGGSLMGGALGGSLMGGALGVSLMGGALGGTGAVGMPVSPYLALGGVGGMVPTMGQGLFTGSMSFPGQGFGMVPGLSPVMPYMNLFYGTGIPYGYGGAPYYNQFGSAYSNLLRGLMASTSGTTGVPVFRGPSGQIVSPYPSYPLYGTLGGYYPFPTYTPSMLPTTVTGYVFDEDNFLALEGVMVSVEGSSIIHTQTAINGYYQLTLQPGSYTLVYTKAGYVEERRTITASGGGVKELPSVFLGPNPNKPPVLEVTNLIEVIAGDTIYIDLNAYDPDPGDVVEISFHGDWVTAFPYVTTEADIGSHFVTVVAEDSEGSTDSQEVMIIVYPWYQMNIYVGLNLISYPFEDGDPDFSAFDLLPILGDANQIDAIAFCPGNGQEYLTAWYEDGQPEGIDFPIEIGQGYIVYASKDLKNKVFNKYTQQSQELSLDAGINYVGIASYPEGYTSYELLVDLGYDYVQSIYRFNPGAGKWNHTYWYNNLPSGDMFLIRMGEGYKIQMKMDLDYMLSRQRYFAF